ncbi:MAG: translation elongation factor Ts [Planctomycetes bacterium]|nr:translation elongation factor Ts [Planctomycetota bacterium]
MAISAAQVMAFREKVGLPMMDCKQALTECNGDEEKALEWLRAKGKGRVEKAATREASEGRIGCHVDAATGVGGIVELRCETAPVASTDDFIRLTQAVARQVVAAANPVAETLRTEKFVDKPSQTLGDHMDDVFNRLREKIEIKRVARVKGHAGQYVHFNGRVGVLVEMSVACPDEVKADVCMHIAAMKPRVTRREDVDPAAVEKEKAVFAEEAKGKPAPVVEKMVTGKLGRWFSEFVLLEQAFVKDDKRSVGDMLKSVNPALTVNRFVRFEVGVV